MKKALLFDPLDNHEVKCNLCNHRCVIGRGKRGICSVRENSEGVLYSLVYGKIIAKNVDPVEKKPLYHIYPGSRSYSIATVGCNFTCRFCQNADIAQLPSDRGGLIMGEETTPGQIVADAEQKGCQTIAYTYTEPTIFFEFALETARIAHSRQIANIFVTNGYMSPEALEMIHPWLDAANVDLKAFSDEFYRHQCGARLAPVKETLRYMKSLGILTEVTTLLIPGLNDRDEDLHALASFIASDLGVETPWHISRFHPTYRLTDRQPTPVQTLKKALRIGQKVGLRYVYTGNVPGEANEKTMCYACGKLLIDRWGFTIRHNFIINGRCPSCGTIIDGIGMSPPSAAKSLSDK